LKLHKYLGSFLLPAFCFLLLSGCHSIPPPTPIDQLNAQQRSGYTVFQTHCATCHNDRVDESRHGPALVGIFNLMPAQPYLDAGDITDLLAYLHTL
jgi:cytochrome c peroxidase